jgi:hypothetical protein
LGSRAEAGGQSGRRHSPPKTALQRQLCRALGARHAQPRLPDRPRFDGGDLRRKRGDAPAEAHFDAFTATFSPSHGYHALATLARSAQAAGLDRKAALTAAAHAIAGGIFYWQESGQTLDELLREAATPGGTAAATMAAMNRAGYERVVAKGLWTGIKQARINARR